MWTKTPGIGGRLRQRAEDFIVEEIPVKKSNESDEHTIFWMEKLNWDTNQALRAIAKKLHVSVKRFGIAGTKDKRALTKQRVSVWKILPEELEKISVRDIKIYGLERGDRISLGDMKGNKFNVIIRDISLSKDEIEKRLTNLFKELKKMPNSFGPQRFGEVRELTHLVGKEILKGNFEEATKLYLCKIFEGEPEDAKKAREFLAENWNKDGFKKALDIFPIRLRYERAMLDYLSKYPNDYAGCIRRLPKRLRKMFLNAYQSAIWNEIAEKLIEKRIKNAKIPLVGFNTVLNPKNSVHKEIIEILKKDDIVLEDFIVKSMPELKCYGSERNIFIEPKDIKIIKIFEDELNQGKMAAEVAFTLPSGSYATVFLKEIMKND